MEAAPDAAFAVAVAEDKTFAAASPEAFPEAFHTDNKVQLLRIAEDTCPETELRTQEEVQQKRASEQRQQEESAAQSEEEAVSVVVVEAELAEPSFALQASVRLQNHDVRLYHPKRKERRGGKVRKHVQIIKQTRKNHKNDLSMHPLPIFLLCSPF